MIIPSQFDYQDPEDARDDDRRSEESGWDDDDYVIDECEHGEAHDECSLCVLDDEEGAE